MQNKKEVAIQFTNIVFGYNRKQLIPTIKNISFDIYDGEYICIVGSNGSGKSTISKILIGLLKPWSGSVSIYGTHISNLTLKKLRDNVGVIFQNPDNQFIGLTAEDDIAFGLENRLVNATKMWPIIKQVAGIVNIEDLLHLNANRLSGGQKQRVAIASVLAMNPRIIIFDESTSMLDPTSKKDLKELMIVLKEKYHKTIISITHDMEEIIHADRVLVIKNGSLQEFDKPEVVFENEDFLKNNNLDFPFALNLSRLIKNENPSFPLTLDKDKLAREVSKLWKK